MMPTIKKTSPYLIHLPAAVAYGVAIYEIRASKALENGGLGGLSEFITAIIFFVAGLGMTALTPLVMKLCRLPFVKGFFILWLGTATLCIFIFMLNI